MANYNRDKYLEKRPYEKLSKRRQDLRDITHCQIGDCVAETSRLNSAKCKEHEGICTVPGCMDASWNTSRGTKLGDSRYCPFHTGRARNGKDMFTPRGKAPTVISLDEDPINFDRWDGTWRLGPYGYLIRHVRTVGGRTLTQHQHRVIMEEHLGRYLERHENVHHKNGWILDNRISNLELWDKPQTPGQRVTDKIDWCFEYLGERGMVIEDGAVVYSDTNIGWVAYPPRKAMADLLGRALYEHEIVGVVDRDRRNLTPENLELWTKSSPESYEEDGIIFWMKEFLPQYGYRVVD